MARNQWQAMQDTVARLTQALQNVVQAGNQAAAARNEAGDLHWNFRSLNPPRFSGSPDPDEAENWKEEIERIFQVEGMRGKDISRPTFIKRGAVDTTGTFPNNNNNNYNNNKRPTTGKDYSMEKKIKVEETTMVEYCKFCNKPGHQGDKCWKKAGACLRCGSHEHRIPNCPMLKDQVGRNQGVVQRQGRVNAMTQAELPEGGMIGRVEELLVAEELWNDHKKPFFFPFSSAATCTNHSLKVDQRYKDRVSLSLSITDLASEKMRPDEEFVQFADRWRSIATRLQHVLSESEQIKIIISNSTPTFKHILAMNRLDKMEEHYERGRYIQTHLMDSPIIDLFKQGLRYNGSVYTDLVIDIVDTPIDGVDIGSESLKLFHEDKVKCVDTVPGSVDTRPSLQKTQLPDWDSVSTQPVACADTLSGSVDTLRLNFHLKIHLDTWPPRDQWDWSWIICPRTLRLLMDIWGYKYPCVWYSKAIPRKTRPRAFWKKGRRAGKRHLHLEEQRSAAKGRRRRRREGAHDCSSAGLEGDPAESVFGQSVKFSGESVYVFYIDLPILFVSTISNVLR
ncbi:hypothetical protein Taro_000949 [Colocasia esculenta]|uniref:CCHC-type domain-containing protein n=1 Tax=Colocasia esculenta TaxID=4460 RepID=A0A843TEU0_COLES|nr:hypothetical protein [Colocasia esculenta]